MKVGIQTQLLDVNGYGRWKNDTYIKMREHGYTCVDYPMANTNTPIYQASVSEAVSILIKEKELADEAGIEIVQTHGPWRWPPADEKVQDRMERMKKMRKCIYFNYVLGCKYMVVHPIMPFGVNDINNGNEIKTREINLEFFCELLKTAKEYGVTICLENMPEKNFSLSKPAEILGFIKEINSDYLKICLDTGHAFVHKDVNLYDEIRRLGSNIKAMHIHDNKCGVDLHLMPYFGNINWKDFVEALKDINYKGNFTLETMPPRSLSTPIFEQMCISLVQTAKEIVSYIDL